MNRVSRALGRVLANYLDQPVSQYIPFAVVDPATLQACLRPGDVLLVEGNHRISTAIKFLTQSTWSHAALYVGDLLRQENPAEPSAALIEADLQSGVIAAPLGKYAGFNTRICRPVGLSSNDRHSVVNYMISSLGKAYDLKNVFDLVRYLLPQPPVPTRWRRRMLALGSGDPTRAICSTLLAEAFESVRYPILPLISTVFAAPTSQGAHLIKEILHIRHHSLFTPRDFDISPYFQIVKPTIETGFDYKTLQWAANAKATTNAPT
jgi:Permuted papain-like amidase enzyme, YaeF/YiiX, C92 family